MGLLAGTFFNSLNNEYSCRGNRLLEKKTKIWTNYHAHLDIWISAAAVYCWDLQLVDDRTWRFAQRMSSIVNEHSIVLRKKNGWFYTRMRMRYTMLTHMHISTYMRRHRIVKNTHLWKMYNFQLQSLSYARIVQTYYSQWLPENRLKW